MNIIKNNKTTSQTNENQLILKFIYSFENKEIEVHFNSFILNYRKKSFLTNKKNIYTLMTDFCAFIIYEMKKITVYQK